MRSIFVDTGYWIAAIHPRDGRHDKAMSIARELGPCRLVTSDMVLTEVLNAFAERGSHLRSVAISSIEAIMGDASIEVVPQTRQLFQEALALYRQRLDKGWSLTDCASFIIMEKRGIVEALTPDHHFEQNGYRALLQ